MAASLVNDDLIPIAVTVDDVFLQVSFRGGFKIATPVTKFPRLLEATALKRNNWRLIGRGDGIHWPEVNEDISIQSLLSLPNCASESPNP